ncbi:hypothetical protein [Thermogemmatispora sp.]|uniref:hypothetical protein n=1 Tax=Thermogemmatispora sp. TaxID=1968838 RepID=UPI002ACC321E|nr:hypothetical protein [Thermogemmatispora sp.]
MLIVDEGARRLGAFAIGNNYRIQRTTKHLLIEAARVLADLDSSWLPVLVLLRRANKTGRVAINATRTH